MQNGWRCSVITSLTDAAIYVVCHPPVSAEQKLQPLCCYLLPAGGAAEGPSLQLPCRTTARRSPATAQHHRRTDCCQGSHRARGVVLKNVYRDYHPHLPDQSSIIHTCTQEQTVRTEHVVFVYLSRQVVFTCSPSLFRPALILIRLPQLHN